MLCTRPQRAVMYHQGCSSSLALNFGIAFVARRFDLGVRSGLSASGFLGAAGAAPSVGSAARKIAIFLRSANFSGSHDDDEEAGQDVRRRGAGGAGAAVSSSTRCSRLAQVVRFRSVVV